MICLMTYLCHFPTAPEEELLCVAPLAGAGEARLVALEVLVPALPPLPQVGGVPAQPHLQLPASRPEPQSPGVGEAIDNITGRRGRAWPHISSSCSPQPAPGSSQTTSRET